MLVRPNVELLAQLGDDQKGLPAWKAKCHHDAEEKNVLGQEDLATF